MQASLKGISLRVKRLTEHVQARSNTVSELIKILRKGRDDARAGRSRLTPEESRARGQELRALMRW
jgi:hypothetical protein